MKVVYRLKAFGLKVWHSAFLKYTVVCLLGVLIVGFLDDNSVWSHMKNRERIEQLYEEIDVYNAAFKRDNAQIRELDRNPKAIEKIARERYFMKTDDEDIFVLSDDRRTTNPLEKTSEADETVE